MGRSPKYTTPSANGATGMSRTARLVWYGGPWAHYYDIYFGTSSTPPLFAADQALGPSETTSQNQSFTLPTLTAEYGWVPGVFPSVTVVHVMPSDDMWNDVSHSANARPP